MTNRQYLLFVEALAGRGTDAAVEAARKWLLLMEQHGQTPDQFYPGFWPGVCYHVGEGNHPVVGVTWYAAIALAWWANELFLKPKQRAKGEAIRLPTEAEWERAATHPMVLPSGKPRTEWREYPWGNGLTDVSGGSINVSIEANIRESKIGSTSVVGIFPHGAAGCGAEEMGGNVWEWCSTPNAVYPFKGKVSIESLYTGNMSASRSYVLLGGSWGNRRDRARCTYRYTYNPSSHSANFGFRLIRLFSLS